MLGGAAPRIAPKDDPDRYGGTAEAASVNEMISQGSWWHDQFLGQGSPQVLHTDGAAYEHGTVTYAARPGVVCGRNTTIVRVTIDMNDWDADVVNGKAVTWFDKMFAAAAGAYGKGVLPFLQVGVNSIKAAPTKARPHRVIWSVDFDPGPVQLNAGESLRSASATGAAYGTLIENAEVKDQKVQFLSSANTVTPHKDADGNPDGGYPSEGDACTRVALLETQITSSTLASFGSKLVCIKSVPCVAEGFVTCPVLCATATAKNCVR
jgi:hypothetical protein